MFRQKNQNGLRIYEVPAFAESGLVEHGFSTRLGGVSKAPYAELNMGLHTGDCVENVQENRMIFARAFGYQGEDLVYGDQVHDKRIAVISEEDKGKGALDYSTAIPKTDGLITNVPGVVLLSGYADCVPLLFLDPKKKVIGLSHAGWKGTVMSIGVETIRKMEETYQCDKRDILVGIGPSIGPCHYEVDQPLINRFQESFQQWNEMIELMEEGRGRLNLWKANQLPLIEYGVPKENITMSEMCTYCHNDEFFSYRADNGKTGRMSSLLVLK